MGAPSFRSFIAEGWDSTNLDRPFSDSAVSSPGVPIPRPGNRQSFPCPLRSITPRRRTMGIEKPRKEIAAGAEVASTFPGPISRESARSAPPPVYHLNNTPTPPLIYFQNLADNFCTTLRLVANSKTTPVPGLAGRRQPRVDPVDTSFAPVNRMSNPAQIDLVARQYFLI